MPLPTLAIFAHQVLSHTMTGKPLPPTLWTGAEAVILFDTIARNMTNPILWNFCTCSKIGHKESEAA